MLAAGALEVRPATFFTTLAIGRIIRFGVETMLAARYGRRILQWLDSPILQNVVGVFMVLAVVLTILSIIRLVRSTNPSRRDATA